MKTPKMQMTMMPKNIADKVTSSDIVLKFSESTQLNHKFKEIQVSEEDLDKTIQEHNKDEDQSSIQAANDGVMQVNKKK